MMFKVLLGENGRFFVSDDEGQPAVVFGETLDELADSLIAMLAAVNSFDGLQGQRASEWPKTRKRHLDANPCCAACGSDKSLQVHHKKPFHCDPCLELDAENLITLCPLCHFYFGHLLRWKSWNVDVSKDAAWFLGKVKERP
jgi:5-methylcytosine-specific restriction protein A